MLKLQTRLLSPHLSRSLTGLLLTAKYDNTDKLQLSECAQKFNDLSDNKLCDGASVSKIKKCRTFYGLHGDYPVVTLSIISDLKHDSESRDNTLEATRSAIGSGISALAADEAITDIHIDSSANAKAVAEAAELATYKFTHLKSEEKSKIAPRLLQSNLISLPEKCAIDWKSGYEFGNAQNRARYLMEMPANHMTPGIFVNAVSQIAQSGYDNMEVVVHDEEWISAQKMGAFLSVSKGSEEKPYLLELHYRGACSDTKPVCLVGKGVTFDTGGISIKPSKGMDAMRADMGGAACVAAATLGAAALKLPLNIVTIIALCENMPSGRATKPGDVVTAMNGTTIQIDNTDAEGRLILADALTYADTFNPAHVIDMATLTGAIAVGLGTEAVGAYSNDNELWKMLEKGGYKSGDRLWRMPLFNEYATQLKSATADVNNISAKPYGGSITAAKFLQKFTKCESWAHLDIAGVMDSTDSMSYLPAGMSGRPTRSVLEFLKIVSKS